MNEKNRELAERLTKVAAFLFNNPDLPTCYLNDNAERLDIYYTRDLKPADAIRRFGAMEKIADPGSSLFILRKKLDGFCLEINYNREDVCHKVKVGEKVIPAMPERILPATPEQVVEQFEWQCPDSILRSKDEADVLDNATTDAMEEAKLPPTVGLTQAESHLNDHGNDPAMLQ